MTLREQIQNIATIRINSAFVQYSNFSTWVDSLAALAFIEQWPESSDTRAIRVAWKLLHTTGVVNSDPAVE